MALTILPKVLVSSTIPIYPYHTHTPYPIPHTPYPIPHTHIPMHTDQSITLHSLPNHMFCNLLDMLANKETQCHVTAHHVTTPHMTTCHVTARHVTTPHMTTCHVTARHVTTPHMTTCHVTAHHVTTPHMTTCHVTACHVTKQLTKVFSVFLAETGVPTPLTGESRDDVMVTVSKRC